MPTLLSTPLTLTVQPAPPVPTGFAGGSDAGRYDAATDTWTPGRLNGVVNAASWALVPRGRWVEVAGTRIDGLTSTVMAAVNGWTPSALAWGAVMNAWNGFAIDAAGSRLWLVAAGGHADGSNNGIYRFDGFKMAWAVEKMPSDRSLWSTSYASAYSGGGTYTKCLESADRATTKSNALALKDVNDWGYDEIYWDNPEINPGAGPVGNPSSRHVYSSTFFASNSNELVMADRRLWRYSLASGQWTYKRQFPRTVDGAELYALYDEKTNEMLWGGSGDGICASMGYNLATNTWNDKPWSPWAQFAVADARNGRNVTALSVPFPDRADIFPGRYWKYNLDSRSVTAGGSVKFSGGLGLGDFIPTYQGPDGCGMVYIPDLDRYWVLYVMSGWVMRWLQLDPTTTPWTLSPLNFSNASPPSQGKPMRKIVYLPDMKAVLFFSAGDGNGYLYRL